MEMMFHRKIFQNLDLCLLIAYWFGTLWSTLLLNCSAVLCCCIHWHY